MSLGDDKDLVRRFYREAIVERDAGACERLLSADFVHNGAARGRVGQRQAVESFLTAFPGHEHEVPILIGEDDLIAEAWDELDTGAILAGLTAGS